MNARLISGIFLGVTILGFLLFLPLRLLELIVYLILIFSFREFSNLRLNLLKNQIFNMLLISAILLIPWLFYIYGNDYIVSIILITSILLGIFWWINALILVFIYPLGNRFLDSNNNWLIIGIVIHLSFWSSILFVLLKYPMINNFIPLEESRLILLGLIIVSVLMDSIAFFFGKKYGKRKLSPDISPNKTIEGFLGALFITIFLLLPIILFIGADNALFLIFLLFIVCVFSVVGDLLESIFKRVSGVKDSSNIIPGHGGILDRIDSHLAVFPVAVFLLLIIF